MEGTRHDGTKSSRHQTAENERLPPKLAPRPDARRPTTMPPVAWTHSQLQLAWGGARQPPRLEGSNRRALLRPLSERALGDAPCAPPVAPHPATRVCHRHRCLGPVQTGLQCTVGAAHRGGGRRWRSHQQRLRMVHYWPATDARRRIPTCVGVPGVQPGVGDSCGGGAGAGTAGEHTVVGVHGREGRQREKSKRL